jgi:hypothetical protein
VGFLSYLSSEEFHPQFWICPKLGMNLKVRWKQYTTWRGNQTGVRGGGVLVMTLVPQWSFVPSFGFALPEPLYCRLNSSSNQSLVRIKILQILGTDTQFHSNSTTQFCSLYQPHSNWGRNRALHYQTKKEPLKEWTMLKIKALQLWKITMWIL